MPNEDAAVQTPARLRRFALSKWENEGGAAIGGHSQIPISPAMQAAEPASTHAELTRLRVRVIALENLVAALLAQGTDWQLERARDVAAYIAPRRGTTRHPLTVRAAARIVHLIARAGHFQDLKRS